MLLSVQNGGLTNRMSPKEYYQMIKDCGFEAVDWNIDHGWNRQEVLEKGVKTPCIFTKSMEEIRAYWKEQLDAIRQAGLIIGQAHAPFPAYTLSYNEKHPDFLDFAIEVYKKCILLCDEVGCPYLVIHGISRRLNMQFPTHEELDALNRKLYESLIPTLQQTNVTVCLENLFAGNHFTRLTGHCSEPLQAAAFIDALNKKAGKECFGLCLDTGHLFLLHTEFSYYISILGSRIKALHIHDNDGDDDQHLAPYAGRIPWGEFLVALKKVGYSGNLNFETFAQVKSDRLPLPLVSEFLRHIAAIGNYFKSQL